MSANVNTSNILHLYFAEVGIMQYAQSRANEIEALAEEIKKNTGARKVFQSLPIHMRRRAMSHNIKRLPRRLHNIARKEVISVFKLFILVIKLMLSFLK